MCLDNIVKDNCRLSLFSTYSVYLEKMEIFVEEFQDYLWLEKVGGFQFIFEVFIQMQYVKHMMLLPCPSVLSFMHQNFEKSFLVWTLKVSCNI